jgi:hypothetical protein
MMDKPTPSFVSFPSLLEGKKVGFLQGQANFGLTHEEKAFLNAHPAIASFRSPEELLALSSSGGLDVIVVGRGFCSALCLPVLLDALKAGGTLQLLKAGAADKDALALGGFISVVSSEDGLFHIVLRYFGCAISCDVISWNLDVISCHAV